MNIYSFLISNKTISIFDIFVVMLFTLLLILNEVWLMQYMWLNTRRAEQHRLPWKWVASRSQTPAVASNTFWMVVCWQAFSSLFEQPQEFSQNSPDDQWMRVIFKGQKKTGVTLGI